MVRNRYILACALFFIAGAYLWKIKSDGLTKIANVSSEDAGSLQDSARKDNSILFEVDKEIVSQEDIEWEYQLILHELGSAPVPPARGSTPHLGKAEALSLKKRIASGLIERKILYSVIQRDELFNLADSNRYTTCLTQWKDLVDRHGIVDQNNRSRLKSRLCERSLLDQYMAERLFNGLVIQEDEIVKYFEANKAQFRQYESVIIKHILFVDEPTAKRWHGALTTQNFAEMARMHSITPEGKTGGRLGPFMKGMFPAVFDIAFQMKIGEISDILRSNYGYHVILLEEKNSKKKLDLAGARPEITKILLKKKREMIYDAWLERALASVKVSAPKVHL